MSARVCAVCGNAKDLDGGMVCEKGRFVCHACSGKGKGLVVDYTISKCSVCKRREVSNATLHKLPKLPRGSMGEKGLSMQSMRSEVL